MFPRGNLVGTFRGPPHSAQAEGVAFALRRPDHSSVGDGCGGKCFAGAIDRASVSRESSYMPAGCERRAAAVGGGSSEPLSDKLARSKGVICPPAAVDREMQVTPPSGGHLKVIPPPGTPGGDPDVQPK